MMAQLINPFSVGPLDGSMPVWAFLLAMAFGGCGVFASIKIEKTFIPAAVCFALMWGCFLIRVAKT
jgi:hypothetical protein